MEHILSIDANGSPRKWLTLEQACHHYASGEVMFDFGDNEIVYHGGHDKHGEQSKIVMKSIISIKGAPRGKYKRTTQVAQRNADLVFRRDQNICAYCGGEFKETHLTRDHIHPASRGGDNSWMNLVTSCVSCNCHKDDRTPEEANMPLLYLPYVPCLWERFILENRKILGDQLEFLKSKLPAHSRALGLN